MGNRTSASRPSSSLADLRDQPENALLGYHVCAVSYSARIIKMRVARSKLRTQGEIKKFEIESSEAHWTQLDCATSLDSSLTEANQQYFESLQRDPQLCHFFQDFHRLEVGEKIAEGAQADIYEAGIRYFSNRISYDYVVKVLKGDVPLQSFQSQWPPGMLSAQSKSKDLSDSPLISIRGGTLLKDERLKGRFAFLMPRRWGDLRKLIDERMVQFKPFNVLEAARLMLSIARDMAVLHDRHDILHRDLKASNVLVWVHNSLYSNIWTHSPEIETIVSDFECSVGVAGTGFWRAPEILRQLKYRVPNSEVQFTRESDVYSYGMTCYEIVTGCLPFEGILCTRKNYDMVLTGKTTREFAT